MCVGVHVHAKAAPLLDSHKEEEERSQRSALAHCGACLPTMTKKEWEAKGGRSGGRGSRAKLSGVRNEEKTLRGQKECLF